MNELERSLLALGRALDVPDAPDFVPAVFARIESRSPRPLEPRWRRRWVLAVAVALLAALTATLAIPDARSALFRVLHLGGERIELVDDLPVVPIQHDLEFVLGERVTLAEARSRSDFDVRTPDKAPDRVYLGERGTVWFLYGEPEGPRLLVAQTPRLGLPEDVFLKKLAGPGTTVERVDVNGSQGLYLSGEAHVLFLLDENGLPVDETARLARDVLVWESRGVAYRLEGDLSQDDALELAAELR